MQTKETRKDGQTGDSAGFRASFLPGPASSPHLLGGLSAVPKELTPLARPHKRLWDGGGALQPLVAATPAIMFAQVSPKARERWRQAGQRELRLRQGAAGGCTAETRCQPAPVGGARRRPCTQAHPAPCSHPSPSPVLCTDLPQAPRKARHGRLPGRGGLWLLLHNVARPHAAERRCGPPRSSAPPAASLQAFPCAPAAASAHMCHVNELHKLPNREMGAGRLC